MAENFDACLAVTLAYEGDWSDNPADPGGATMDGITYAVFCAWRASRHLPKPGLTDLRNIAHTEVANIYADRYWAPIRGADLPAGVDLAVFDFAVNSGVHRASVILQQCAGLTGEDVDGIIGDETLWFVSQADSADLVAAICDQRMRFLQSLGTWPDFGDGWTRRVDGVRQTAAGMCVQPSPPWLGETLLSGGRA